jgi:hypothetical protein
MGKRLMVRLSLTRAAAAKCRIREAMTLPRRHRDVTKIEVVLEGLGIAEWRRFCVGGMMFADISVAQVTKFRRSHKLKKQHRSSGASACPKRLFLLFTLSFSFVFAFLFLRVFVFFVVITIVCPEHGMNARLRDLKVSTHGTAPLSTIQV